ncbi:MAG: ribokinase [Candidatus Limiplasma sp.]|nr:ribokinase [Candidatus Limiplasma sp.]MEA5146090.1 ribokinase [Candidatus Limiplasma sp.]
MHPNRVVVIGSMNYDMFLQVDALPKVGETYPAKTMQTAAGGKGANQAVQCARLGMETTLVGAVGRETMGEYLRERLSAAGVSTTHVRSVDAPTGLGVVHALPDGTVMATIVQGANAQVLPDQVDAAEPLIRDAFAVLLQLEIPIPTVLHALRVAKRHGVRAILNAAPAIALPEDALRLCDTVIVNEVEASYYMGTTIRTVEEACRAILLFVERYATKAVFTLGALGAVACDGGAAIHIPAVPTQVVETTGAGDSFVGGYVKAISAGMAFVDALRFAARCSAVSISQVGGQDAMPTLAQVEKLP